MLLQARQVRVCRTCKVEIDDKLFVQALQRDQLQKAIEDKARHSQSLREYAPGGKKKLGDWIEEQKKLNKLQPQPEPVPPAQQYKIEWGGKKVFWDVVMTKPPVPVAPAAKPPVEAICEGGPLDGFMYPMGSKRLPVQWPTGAFYAWEYNPVDNTAKWMYYGDEDV